MQRFMMKSKLHGATVTQCNLHYTGSLTVDRNLMELADLLPDEKVQVVNVSTGVRFETYLIEGQAGSGVIGVNGGAARLVVEGDKLLIISYGLFDERELAAGFKPKVILLDGDNQPRP
jgi:aspartate 1-decarboxylase